jgi:hypothetical protein
LWRQRFACRSAQFGEVTALRRNLNRIDRRHRKNGGGCVHHIGG